MSGLLVAVAMFIIAIAGPVTGIPGLRTCMIFHAAIATITRASKQITKMNEMGIDLA